MERDDFENDAMELVINNLCIFVVTTIVLSCFVHCLNSSFAQVIS